MANCYVSFDVETDGNIPGPHSMLSLGAVAYKPDGSILSEFYAKLLPLDGAKPDEATLEWWGQYPEAYAEATTNAIPAQQVMSTFVDWAQKLPGSVVMAADPAGFDGMWLNWYAVRFVGPFEALPWMHRILDIRTVALCLMGGDYKDAHSSILGRLFGVGDFVGMPHKAIDDARQDRKSVV